MHKTIENLLLPDESKLDNLNFLGLTSCPMRQVFKDNLESSLQKYYLENNIALKCYVPSGCHHIENVEELLDNSDIENFPDMFSSLGFNYIFRNNIVNKLMNRGYFKAPVNFEIGKSFIDAGCIDPKGEYAMYSVSPVLLMIDHNKLGSLPIPTKWSDLLNPIYKNNIIIGGSEDEVYSDQVMYFHKEFGIEGIKTLAENTKGFLHPAVMARTAGTISSQGAAIYIVPLFFAKSCPRKENVTIVWPEDGAFISPNFFIVKESKLQESEVLINLLTGVEFGEKCANNYYPSVNAKVDNNLPENAKFKWLGWDYIRSNNIEDIINETNNTFITTWKKYSM